MVQFVRRAARAVVLAATLALAVAGAAQAAWSPAGSLSSGRYNHTATRLDDGRVLVAGGYNGTPLDGAQLYDPATNEWSSAAPMNVARQGDAAVLLHSGKVLVAGGLAPANDPTSPSSGYTRTAEIYDSATNRWTKTASMGTGRFQPTLTVLADGRVLVAGGTGDVDTDQGTRAAVSLESAEIYDPATGDWTDAAPMPGPRAMATATLLRSGEVLVAGGYDGAAGALMSAELYDPSHDSWSPTGSLGEARDSATATSLRNGDVLVAGGDGGAGTAITNAEIYHPEAGTFHEAASMAGARQSGAGALLKDGTVLVAGGEDARLGTPLDTAERYDPAADAWTDAGTVAASRRQHSLTALDDGRALLVGGNPGGFDDGLAGAERFSTVTSTLTPASFGSRPIGTQSDVVSSVLTNTGDRSLVVTGVSIAGADAGDFSIVSNSCREATVEPGTTCEVGLRFMPAAVGDRGATLTITDNATAAGATTAALSGAGRQPAPSGDGNGSGDGTGSGAGTGGGSTGDSTGATGGNAGGAGGSSGPRSGSQSAGAKSARATCKVKTTRRHGGKRSTVACRITLPTTAAVALDARLMRGTKLLAGARTTARGGHAELRLRPNRRLRSGRYTLLIARRDGTRVLRRTIRVS